MSWLLRLGCICLFVASMGACNSGGDVGKPCKLTQDQNISNLKDLDTKARIVEASAACDLLSYCFANFYDESKHQVAEKTNTLGYCSNFCDPDQPRDCPEGFTCQVFIKVSTLPASHQETLAPLVNKTICIKTPPTGEK